MPPRTTQKPPLHGTHWMAITGKPLGAAAGAMIFQQGGNAIDAACAMLAAVTTMWDTLSWGGETQALIYNPKTKKVIGINALGVAPSGATAEYYKSQGYNYPPEYGPLAAVTPGTPGGLMTMLADYGTLSLAQVLAPALQMADDAIEASRQRDRARQGRRSRNKDAACVVPPPANVAVPGWRDLPAAGSAATLQADRDREDGALAGKSRTRSVRPTSILQGRHRAEIARGTRTRRPFTWPTSRTGSED
jgi:gamma-glutamyltranspeptidase/glutathione hydrolase